MARNFNNLGVGFYSPLLQVPVTVIVKKKAPTVANKNYNVGQIWIANTASNTYTIYMFCGVNLTQANKPQGIWISLGTNVTPPTPAAATVSQPTTVSQTTKETK